MYHVPSSKFRKGLYFIVHYLTVTYAWYEIFKLRRNVFFYISSLQLIFLGWSEDKDFPSGKHAILSTEPHCHVCGIS